MAASPSGSGTSSASTTLLTNSGSEGDVRQQLLDERKRKRMLSKRDSARRSLMRKQKHLDDLTARAAGLQDENTGILPNLKVLAQQAMAVKADNSLLRAQLAELRTRLQSLEEILQYKNGNSDGFFAREGPAHGAMDGFFMNPWSLCSANNQAIMASPEVFQY